MLRVGFLSSLGAPAAPMIAAAFRRRVPGVELHVRRRLRHGGRELDFVRGELEAWRELSLSTDHADAKVG